MHAALKHGGAAGVPQGKEVQRQLYFLAAATSKRWEPSAKQIATIVEAPEVGIKLAKVHREP